MKIHFFFVYAGLPKGHRYPNIIKTVVLVCPVLSYYRTFLHPETEWGKSIFNERAIEELAVRKQIFFQENFPISLRLIEEMKIVRPELEINKLTQLTTIIHGEFDSMVPYDVSKEISSEFPKIKFVSIPGMDHGFIDEDDEEGLSLKSQENKQAIYQIILDHCLRGFDNR